MSLRFHEIAESYHRILNPLTEEQLALIGTICRPDAGTRLLDLACGKGELLSTWAARYGLIGVGVDISRVFLDAARERARELEVAESITWVEGDAGAYPEAHHQFNIVSCLGATWIGGGLSGTLALMAQALHDSGGLLLVGEPFWKEPPPEAAYAALDVQPDEFTTLLGTLERIEATGFELVEMVGATPEGWDRYEAPQWLAVDDYLRTHPDDPEAAELRDWIIGNRWNYLAYGRRYFDWAVFVLRPR